MTEYKTTIFYCDHRMSSGYVTLKTGYGILISGYYIVYHFNNIILRDARYHMVIQNRHRTFQYQDGTCQFNIFIASKFSK